MDRMAGTMEAKSKYGTTCVTTDMTTEGMAAAAAFPAAPPFASNPNFLRGQGTRGQSHIRTGDLKMRRSVSEDNQSGFSWARVKTLTIFRTHNMAQLSLAASGAILT